MFQKVDLNAIKNVEIPSYPKTLQQMDEIIPLLQGNFMTKKLPQDLIQRLAGAM